MKDIRHLKRPLQSLGIGTYVKPQPDDPFFPIQTARMNTTVFDVVHLFSEQGISAVPIIDDDGIVVNLYETVDVIVSCSPPLLPFPSLPLLLLLPLDSSNLNHYLHE